MRPHAARLKFRTSVGIGSRLRPSFVAAAFKTIHFLKLRGAIVPQRATWGGDDGGRRSVDSGIRFLACSKTDAQAASPLLLLLIRKGHTSRQ